MKKLIVLFSFCLFLFANSTNLTQKEKEYLKKNNTIKVCINPDWVPIEFRDKKGNPQGISIDTLKIIANKLNIKFQFIKTSSWIESQKFLKEKKCDITPTAVITDKREKYAIFTKPYLNYHLAVITTNEKPLINNLDEIANKTMTRKKGSGLISKMKKLYPNIKIIKANNFYEMFQLVNKKKVYFTIATIPVFEYYKKRYHFNNLTINAYTDFKYNLRIMVRKDKPILKDILDKSLDLINPQIKKEIYQKWTLKVKPIIEYKKYLIFTLITFSIIILFFFFQNYYLKRKIKLATKILEEKNKNFDRIFNSTMEMIILSNENLKIIKVNSSVKNFNVKDEKEIIGKNILDFIHKDDIEKVKESFKEEKSKIYELRLIYKGKIIPVIVKGEYITIEGEKVRISFIQDITFLKENEQLIQTSKAKSEFLANMSHEIRTPLNAVMGFIEFLKEECKEHKKAENYLEIIEDSSESLIQIINDILDFSKIESGKLDINKEPFETKKEFNTIIHLFEAKSHKKNINLILDIDKNIPEVLISDPLRIKQIIANLLSNALKFTPEGKTIKIKLFYKKGELFVSVKDEGIGIPKEKQTKIFKAFSQADNSTTRKYGGTGLGLTISYKLVKMLGGELKLKSEVNKGSEFYFAIPVEIGKLEKKEENKNKDINFEGKKILLVEDNKANQMFMQIMLKKLKLDFDIANDGIEAIEKYKQNRYDVIFMDENMPNMNGIEATKRIRRSEKENSLSYTPIIALTANAIKGDREKFLNAGMDDYLSKPVSKNDVIEKLSKFLK